MKKKVLISLLLGVMAVSTTLNVHALSTSNPSGGYWKYGAQV